MPWLKFGRLFLVYFGQLVGRGAHEVGGTQYLIWPSQQAVAGCGRSTYVRRMVVELEIVVDDRVVDVVRFDEVFESASAFLWSLFDVVHLD